MLVTPHTFRHSCIMHTLFNHQPPKVIQAWGGHKDARSMEVYTQAFALDEAATLSVSFSGGRRRSGRRAAIASAGMITGRKSVTEAKGFIELFLSNGWPVVIAFVSYHTVNMVFGWLGRSEPAGLLRALFNRRP